ncbi:long-chain-fatty-acid--CoA ligase-related protein [Azotobacter vinelandii CA]|uniref:Long-chain-fatty-acid--CoA ligase-related protein n=2 Tax=Azotobacter vinelandii TaxID=354 RepID=C1DFT0_AZOVD|nr:AMP-binding protein [Azotobacter vinelandii]ACO80476.1 long-chain-fatty-acid--CoA ligase-related protein [Azotobacter vinelandii DJ]AGK15986.1 long-chain-fatty-acid--CoA ligase-related protein [Azotobacter vinelandii CA]AGK21936.1 long-chain-fatty-acid--CoA ligase-related protein [Azotobacter vinelandii CA6]SFX35217.1 AMP-binding enzyme [Azotobacter vinelandii]GLK58523.1 acyl-CoA synthetase [Azotobacter vinelandii]
MVRFADGGERVPATLPDWLRWQAQQQGESIALRHKRLGIWQARTWTQVAGEVRGLASALQVRGFAGDSLLVILSRPRPEALLAALAAQWLGGVAALFDPLAEAAGQRELLRELQPDFVFAETLDELERLRGAGLAPRLTIYAEARGVRAQEGEQDYARLLAGLRPAQPEPQAQAGRGAFAFYRRGASGRSERQLIGHDELLRQGRQLVQAERLGAQEEALAARAFAAGGQARYLLAPWLIAGFRLNFPESLATRDNDRRELGPTLVAGTRETYGRLHELALARLPQPGSVSRHLVDWALARRPGLLRQTLGHWLVRRPLRDVLGFSRTRTPLLVGEPLPRDAEAFFAGLGVAVRAWPDPSEWHSPPVHPLPSVDGWVAGGPQPV